VTSQPLSKGANAALPPGPAEVVLHWQARAGLDADLSALLVGTDGRVGAAADLVFYNNPVGGGGSVRHLGKTAAGPGVTDRVSVDLAAVPAVVDRVVVAASIDGPGGFGQLGGLGVEVVPAGGPSGQGVSYPITDASSETALVFVELYRRGGGWKVRAVGQGYDTGLAGLATDFGVSVDDAPVPSAAQQIPAPPISLEKKRLVDLEKRLESRPALLSLVKTAGVSLTKRGLGEHTARVALCLDISASMYGLYSTGAVEALTQRVLALALRFDDDGEVDVFLFGGQGHVAPPLSLADAGTYISDLMRTVRFEGSTRYAEALKLVREHYFGSSGKRLSPRQDPLPVYLMFVTDGATSDRGAVEEQLRWGSHEPMYVQFMGIGKDRGPRGEFAFLHQLDDLSGRLIDNAGFFALTPDQLMGRTPIGDDELFDLLMTEYPGWLPAARAAGLLPG